MKRFDPLEEAMKEEAIKKFRKAGEMLKSEPANDPAKELEPWERKQESQVTALREKEMKSLVLPENIRMFFNENAGVGTENISSGALPQLKITEANSKNLLQNGNFSTPGQLYYSPTKEEFPSVLCSLLAVSRGFYTTTKELDGETLKRNEDGTLKLKFTQLVGGMILANQTPFVTFVSGTRLDFMWQFGKEVKLYTKNTPMFAFEVLLSTQKVETKWGFNSVIKYELTKDEEGNPSFIRNLATLEYLKKAVDLVKEMFAGFIRDNEVNPDGSLTSNKTIEVVNEIKEGF